MDISPIIAGIDEAGRGPLAGPVVAAAVILDPARPIEGLADSKKLSAKRREALAGLIRANAIYAVGIAEPEEIDRLNILHATMAAMSRAVCALPVRPDRALIDGNRVPDGLPFDADYVIGGDAIEPAISAASIIAKTVRDRLMTDAEQRFSGYGFAGHKGYGAAAHMTAIRTLGPCPIHRRSFAPIRQGRLV
ncbi:ribonuclease HII [Hyphobacterium marinum]|uniref:Ribonuclease HII n=1 Tax=Hyphobacterium marinum TaxID=3116574 RepID=A0ABU7M1S0_9PROT|nr:ribonuclease HII [Hyphobacterium sp. Y6023]MEE2567482.1 ribonuclease HII [Hyphobacterium sp. Y6023]